MRALLEGRVGAGGSREVRGPLMDVRRLHFQKMGQGTFV